jgi:autotransporter-associated beta strand protein
VIGVLDLNGFSNSVGSLTGNGTVTNSGISAILTAGDISSTTFSGMLQNALHLTKVGSGTLILSGANTYTGNTTITAGTLQLGDGAAAAASLETYSTIATSPLTAAMW